MDIAGTGPARDSLLAQVRQLGLEQAVTLPGRVSEQAKNDLLSRAWLTVAPSLAEGWGLTVLEANTAGHTRGGVRRSRAAGRGTRWRDRMAGSGGRGPGNGRDGGAGGTRAVRRNASGTRIMPGRGPPGSPGTPAPKG